MTHHFDEPNRIWGIPLGKNPGDTLRVKTANESFRGPNVMRQAPEPGEEGAFCPLGKNPADFQVINTKPFKGAHFAVFPPEICVRPILSSCPPDGIVLDPMAGSGTLCYVAKVLNAKQFDKLKLPINKIAKVQSWSLKFVGIELNPNYCAIARRRLELDTIPLVRRD